MSRLDILKASLRKKEELLDAKFEEHFESVKSANGQPLNDKRNGVRTLESWERQNSSIRKLRDSIDKTKAAIEIEEAKILNVANTNSMLPMSILQMLDSGQLRQWRRHPNTFFVKDVPVARIVWDMKDKTLGTRYRDSIKDDEAKRLFSDAYTSLVQSLKDELKAPNS